MSALRYVKITAMNNTFVVWGDSKSALQALLSKWDQPTVNTILFVTQSYGNFWIRTC